MFDDYSGVEVDAEIVGAVLDHWRMFHEALGDEVWDPSTVPLDSLKEAVAKTLVHSLIRIGNENTKLSLDGTICIDCLAICQDETTTYKIDYDLDWLKYWRNVFDVLIRKKEEKEATNG